MNLQKLETFARKAMALGSLGVMVGGTVIFFGLDDIGDGIMIGGLALLIVGVAALVQIPAGETIDAD